MPIAPLDPASSHATPLPHTGSPKMDDLAGPEAPTQDIPPPQPHQDQGPLGGPVDHEEDDEQGPPSKRQRLDEPSEEPSQPLHEDEAVLALAAHNGGSNVDSVDPYASEYPHPDPGHPGGLDGDSHPFDAYGDP